MKEEHLIVIQLRSVPDLFPDCNIDILPDSTSGSVYLAVDRQLLFLHVVESVLFPIDDDLYRHNLCKRFAD